MLAQVLTCIGASAAVFLTYTLLVVVRTEPWYSPQYFIPILGEVSQTLDPNCAVVVMPEDTDTSRGENTDGIIQPTLGVLWRVSQGY